MCTLQITRVDLARTTFKQGLDRDPVNGDIFLNWGKLEAYHGDLSEAELRLQRAKYLMPNDPAVFDALAQLSLKKRDPKQYVDFIVE